VSKTLIYVAGPYSAQTRDGIQRNIEKAMVVSQSLWRKGFAVICPHGNTAHMSASPDSSGTSSDGNDFELFLSGDEEMILRCDAIYFLTGWEDSRGSQREHRFAKEHSIPIYYEGSGEPPMHPTNLHCPVQSRAFLSETMKMYRTHLDKNADYSPANILGTGEVGLVTRLWDKMARLMNLMGFDLELASPAIYRSPKEPKNESIEDNLRDLSVYAIIGQLLRRGLWGH